MSKPMKISLLAALIVVAATFSLLFTAGSGENEPPTPETPGKEKPVPAPKPGVKPKYKHTNRLAKETSPYLLQHAHNPVDWYPWGAEAFAKARQENKPIFLSVGYSSCHWCHVMERESFEHEDVAKLLNDNFVSMKVDREERPDVDEIYMKYVQMTRQSGGWPMSIVMTPQGVPFFGGTYYPKAPFMDLMRGLARAWKEKQPQIQAHCLRVVKALKEQAKAHYRPPERLLSRASVTRLVGLLDQYFDYRNGGLQSPRKFPPHSTLTLLLHLLAQDAPPEKARRMVTLTLDKMQLGGIHDHVGGGFHRYATDTIWFLPHFEKMLYDNAQLAQNYARAAVLLKDEAYARTARDTYDWVLRAMRNEDGVFYSALDADSEGEEGKFYVWDKKELDRILGADAERFDEIYNIRAEGNFQDEASKRDSGKNIPHLSEPLAQHAQRLNVKEAVLRAQMKACLEKLRAVRAKRVWPGCDDKVLTSWNALMIGSLAQGGRYLKEKRYLDAALQAAHWMLKNMRDKHGRWLATHRKGVSKLAAYLDDHANLASAFLDLYKATGDEAWKQEAVAVVKIMNEHFWDPEAGGYFFVADDHEKLLVRMKNPNDNVTPSGNGVAAQVLVRLARITGEKQYAERAAKIFRAFHTLLDAAPVQVESMLLALDQYFEAGYKLGTAAQAPKASATRGPVTASLFVGLDKLRAGAKAPIAVRLKVGPGYHVQAHRPAQKELIATRFKLDDPALGRLSNEKYPEPLKLAAPELGGELLVYGGEVLMGAWLEVPKDAKSGPRVLQVEVTFQACNDKACLAPETVLLGLPVEIVPANKSVQAQHSELFKKLGLSR